MSVDPSVERSSLPVLIPLGQFAKSPAIKLSRPVYVLGSKERCRIRLQSSTVSSTHALLVQTRHITYIRDLCSRTGLFINGQQIKEAVLHDGDLLAIGKFTFKYQGPKKKHADEPSAPPAALQAAGADLPIPMENRTMVIGRRASCDIPLLEESASTTHAVILAWEGKRFVRDLWSRSGTYVNGKSVHEQEISPGDVIRCGETDITYAPSIEEAAFSVIEGASDSIAAEAPTVEEIDLGLSVVPRVSANDAPLEVIVPPQTPPRQQELLPLEPLEPQLIESSPHDTAHVPLSIHIEPAEAQPATSNEIVIDSSAIAKASETASSEPVLELPLETVSDSESSLPRRGWRSAIQEAEAELSQTGQTRSTEPVEPLTQVAAETSAVTQATPATEIIEPTQPTLESALDLPASDSATSESPESGVDLTDTTFGRSVEEFEGESLGPIIETAESSEPAAETSPIISSPPTASPEMDSEPVHVPPPTDLSATIDTSSVDAMPIAPEEPLVPIEEASAPIEPEPLAEIPSEIPTSEPAQAVEETPLDPTTVDQTPAVPTPVEEQPIEQPQSVDVPAEMPTIGQPPSIETHPLTESSPVEPLAAEEPLLMSVETSQVIETNEPPATIAPPPASEIAAAVEIPAVQLPLDEPQLPLESIAPISEMPAPPDAIVEQTLSLDDDEASTEPVAASPEDTAMMVLATETAEQIPPIESASIAPHEQPLLLEPLPEPQIDAGVPVEPLQIAATLDDTSEPVPAELTTTPIVEPQAAFDPVSQDIEQPPADDLADDSVIESPVVESPILESPVIESPIVELPVIDLPVAPVVESPAIAASAELGEMPLIENEPIVEIEHGIGEIPEISPPLHIAAIEEPLSPLPTFEEPSTPFVPHQATMDYSAADHSVAPVEESTQHLIHLSTNVEESVRGDSHSPVSIEPSLDLSRLQPAEEQTAVDLSGDDHPAAATLIQPAADLHVDLSRLQPVEETIEHDATPLDQPLTTTLEVASQPPVDALSPAVAEDPVDLSFLDSARPVDEYTAAELFEADPFDLDSKTPSDTNADDGLVVIDHSAIDHGSVDHSSPDHDSVDHSSIDHTVLAPLPTDEVEDSDLHTHVEPDSETLAPQSSPEFPDLLPSTLDDAVLMDPPITLKTEPVPPPPGADAPIKIQPAPGIRPRKERKPRVIRNAFGQDPDAPRPGVVVIPPFSDTASVGSSATLTSLSQAPARETDVFSDIPHSSTQTASAQAPADIFALPGAPEGDVFASEVAKTMRSSSLTGLAEETNTTAPAFPPQARRARPRSARPGIPMVGPRPAVAFADEESLNAAAERRRKLLRRAPILMGLMLLLIAGTWAGVWFLVPVKRQIETALTFRNFAAKTQREQRLFQAEQGDRFKAEATRNVAVHKLQDLRPGTPPDFISDPVKYDSIETSWPESSVGQMVLRYESTNPQIDKVRLQAVALAMYDSNSQLADQTRTLKSTLQSLQNLSTTNADKIKELSKRIESERALVDQAPTQAQIDKLTADDKDLEAKYNDALGKAKDGQADLDRLKQQQAKEAAAANADPASVDDEIQKMTKDADALSAQLAAARKSRADMATQARATLDAAYDEFKKQLDTAQDAAKANPQLAAYVNAAQNLQAAIRDLTDQYIQHQQQDYNDLNTLKSNFEAKMTDRKATLLANDPKLKDLSEQKEIITRKHNEAINSGLDKDASDLVNELKLIDTAIKAQQEIVSNDPVYNEMITGLQQLIDQKQRSINDERKKTDEKLASLRQSFNKSAAGVSQMPADQQEVATAMRDRLAAIDAARKQYAEAADASAADADVDIKRMNDDLHTLQTNIEARKKQLAAANSPELRKAAEDERAEALAKKTQQVADLNALMADALTAYKTTHTNLLKGTAAANEAKLASDRLEAAVNQRDTLSKQKVYNDGQLDSKLEEAKRAVEPVEPTADDVHIVGDPIDNRAQLGLGASGIIFVGFAIAIILTLRGAARESHYTYTPPIEPLETPASPKLDADAEENEPVVA